MRPLSNSLSEHRLFSAIAFSITAIVLAGFLPLYTLRLLHHDPNLTLLVHLHGLVMTSWIALFLLQTLLIATHRTDLHRRLGVLGICLAVLIVLVGAATVVHSAARQSGSLHSAQFFWMLAAFDGLALLAFAVLFSAAMIQRRRPATHKRLMLLATLSLLGPAVGRLTLYANGFRGESDLAVLLLCAGLVLAAALADTLRSHRFHPAFLWGGALVLLMDLATFLAKKMI